MNEKQTPNPYGVSPNEAQALMPSYKNNNLAIASLVLGILSIFLYFFTAIPGIITGHMARSKAKGMPDEYDGGGMALTGLFFNYIMLVVSIVFIASFSYILINYPEFKDAFLEGMQEELKTK